MHLHALGRVKLSRSDPGFDYFIGHSKLGHSGVFCHRGPRRAIAVPGLAFVGLHLGPSMDGDVTSDETVALTRKCIGKGLTAAAAAEHDQLAIFRQSARRRGICDHAAILLDTNYVKTGALGDVAFTQG